MTSSATVKLHIGNALPHGNEQDSRKILALWQEIDTYLKQRPFTAQSGIKSHARPYRVTLQADGLLDTMEHAKRHSATFTEYRTAHIENAAHGIDAELSLIVDCEDHDLDEVEAYQVATVLFQHLVMAANICLPGSIQILDGHFTGEGAHRFEAPTFDSKVFYGALKTVGANHWPDLQVPSLDTVWSWLENCEVSKTHTAIKDINKVLFTLLKVAEQRQEYSARTVMLVMYQLEVLLNCRNPDSLERLRQRARMVLGNIPEAADCFAELHEVRNSLFLANQPVHRPPLLCHTTAEALREQIGQHNTAVESGTAMVLALLQDLIIHQAQSYAFSESFTRR